MAHTKRFKNGNSQRAGASGRAGRRELGQQPLILQRCSQGTGVTPLDQRPARMGWARLLKRMFDIDMRRCPRCGGVQVKIIAAILERAVIGKILTHLGLEPQPPPRSKAREAGPGDEPEPGIEARMASLDRGELSGDAPGRPRPGRLPGGPARR
jgi:hypothetical protein